MKQSQVADALVARARQMSGELTEWARTELLLGLGQRVLISILIDEVPAVLVAFTSVEYDRVLTTEDWQEVFSFPWNASKLGKQLLEIFALIQNSSHQEAELSAYKIGQYNGCLQRLGAPYKLMRTRYSVRRGYNFYTLCGRG